jgi:Histidine kinase-, DNA gyrase B-, and HSP90-like ATPase
MVDLTPVTHFIENYRNNNVRLSVLCGEAVDNSFDAGATRVDIKITNDTILFKDNGVGVTNDRISSLCRLGDHAAMSTTALGRYGIGIKEQSCAAGDVFRIRSRSADGLMRFGIDWGNLAKSGSWEVPDPIWSDDKGATFTEVQISRLRSPPKSAQVKKLKTDLERIFQPAIVSGSIITLNDETLHPVKDPPMKNVIEQTIEFDGDKYVSLRAGILKDPSNNSLNSVHVSYKHRVIMPQSIFGCGDGVGASFIFARVVLHGDWGLGKNKTEITDQYKDELENRLYEILAPILESGRKTSMTARVSEATDALNGMLPDVLRPAKIEKKKDKKEETRVGQKRGRNSGGAIKNAPENNNGMRRGKAAPVVAFEFVPNLQVNGAHTFGCVVGSGKNIVVQIRGNDPVVTRLVNKGDIGALYRIGLLIYAQGINRIQPQLDLDDFGVHVLSLIGMQSNYENTDKAA